MEQEEENGTEYSEEDKALIAHLLKRRFDEESLLFQYLKKYSGSIKDASKVYRIGQIVIELLAIINEKNLLYPQIPSLVVCDDELEAALGFKIISKSNLVNIVASKTTEVADRSLFSREALLLLYKLEFATMTALANYNGPPSA